VELLKESFVQRKGVLRKRDATEKCSAFRTKGSTYVENEIKSRIEWRFERILVVCGEVVAVNTAEANRMQERRYRGGRPPVSNKQLFIQRNRVAINWKNKAEGEECDCIVMSLSVRGNGVSGKESLSHQTRCEPRRKDSAQQTAE
jgi:hypothetical protein